jgi:hypothetical protein
MDIGIFFALLADGKLDLPKKAPIAKTGLVSGVTV